MVSPDFTAFALTLADAARRETLRRNSATFAVENKASGRAFDPVTEADREAERAMRDLIVRTFPNHAVSGEEFGFEAGNSPFCWSLDPIDGTRSYMTGLPTWTTLIGLLENGEPLLGVIDAPRLDERYAGADGTSWMVTAGERTALRTSPCTQLSDARFATTDPFLFASDGFEAVRTLCEAARTTRFGHDAYAYARLAAGTIDLVVECGLKPHDYHALIPVVRGAGGMIGDWAGGTDFAAGRVIAAATAELYEAAVAIMRGAL